MKILLNEEEILTEINANRNQLPSIDELHLEIWDCSKYKKVLVMSMIYRDTNRKVLKMEDYLTLEIAECNLENEIPIELQTYGRLLKTYLKKKFPNKKISSTLRL